MSWSAGAFSRLLGATAWRTDEVGGTGIESIRHDDNDQDLAAGINACLHKGGTNEPTANLPMGGFKHTGVASAAARTDYASAAQVQDGSLVWGGTSGGAADVQTLTLTPAITAYAAGQAFRFIAGYTNATTTPTLNVNAVGAITIIDANDTALVAGQITAGKVYTAIYDGTNFVLQTAKAPAVSLAVDSTSRTTTSGTYADLTGASTTVTVGTGQKVLLTLSLTLSAPQVEELKVKLLEGSSDISGSERVVDLEADDSSGQTFTLTTQALLTSPTVGSQTYKAQWALGPNGSAVSAFSKYKSISALVI